MNNYQPIYRKTVRNVTIGETAIVLFHQSHLKDTNAVPYNISLFENSKEGLGRAKDAIKNVSGYCRLARMEVLV